MCWGVSGRRWEGWVGVREVSGRCRGDVEEVCRGGSRRSGWDACVGRAWGVRVWQLVLVSLAPLYYADTLVNLDTCLGLEIKLESTDFLA